MRNIYNILSKIDFEKHCEQYALGFQRDADTPTMTKFRQESMKEFCFGLIQEFYEIILQDHWQEVTAVDAELKRTRKALYLAFEMLKDIKNDPDTNDELTQEIADRLSEIKTALEQKEVK